MDNTIRSLKDEVITVPSTNMTTRAVRLCPIKNSPLHPTHPNQQHRNPTVTILSSVLNDYGYLERNLQVKMRYNMPFGDLATLIKTKFGVPEYFGLEMKARRKDGVYADGVRLIFGSDTPVSVCFA
jgi:hypothetical protein